MIKIINPNTIPDMKNPHGVSLRKLYDSEYSQVLQINLLPGEKVRKHITAVHVFFYILEGTGVVEIGEDRAEVSVGMLIESPPNLPHRFINEGNAPFRFLVVKTYDRAKTLKYNNKIKVN